MDRNKIRIAPIDSIIESLSARRAWIEIGAPTTQAGKHAVALRKESVDRNSCFASCRYVRRVSLSARRAWIEMCGSAWPPSAAMVALRKESVDRNAVSELVLENVLASLSARRAWIEIAAAVKGGVTDGSLSARRAWIEIDSKSNELQNAVGRSPQGERG